MITGASIVAAARNWLGTPYIHQGRSRFGVDCIGFIICVRNAVSPWPEGMEEIRNYARKPKDGLLLARFAKHCTRIDVVEDGCVILIKWPLSKEPSHCGIYGQGNILHAYQRAGKAIETGYRAHWLRDTDSLWRLPGVAP